jgi:hypothetical protein
VHGPERGDDDPFLLIQDSQIDIGFVPKRCLGSHLRLIPPFDNPFVFYFRPREINSLRHCLCSLGRYLVLGLLHAFPSYFDDAKNGSNLNSHAA